MKFANTAPVAAGRGWMAAFDPDTLELSLGHLVAKIDGERADKLVALGADRLVPAMSSVSHIQEARDLLSAYADRLGPQT